MRELLVSPGGRNYARIADAVRAAAPGQTIRVAPGVYVELVFVNRPVTIVGEPGAVIDVADGNPLGVAGAQVTVAGLTIRTHSATHVAAAVYGGGLLRLDACTVVGLRSGAARASGRSTLEAQNCRFSAVNGIGVRVDEGSRARLRSSLVADCGASGVVVNASESFLESVRIERCLQNAVFVTDRAMTTVTGSQLSSDGSYPVLCCAAGSRLMVERTTMQGSRSSGVDVSDGSQVTVTDSSFSGLGGCGVAVSDNSQATVDRVRVHDCGDGILVSSSKARLSDLTVTDTRIAVKVTANGDVEGTRLEFVRPTDSAMFVDQRGRARVSKVKIIDPLAFGVCVDNGTIDIDELEAHAPEASANLVVARAGGSATVRNPQLTAGVTTPVGATSAGSLVLIGGRVEGPGGAAATAVAMDRGRLKADGVTFTAGVNSVYVDSGGSAQLTGCRLELAIVGVAAIGGQLRVSQSVITGALKVAVLVGEKGSVTLDAVTIEDCAEEFDVHADARLIVDGEMLSAAAAGGPVRRPARPRPRGPATADPQALAAHRAELESLVGLETVKREVDDLLNLVEFERRQTAAGVRVAPIVRHVVFAGPPGTGKTTVARLWGEILAASGVLPSGHLVETDRSGLVAGFIGQTAIKTTEKFNEALGGVLFIDEAYALLQKGGDFEDFGVEAVNALVKLMDDHRDDVVVIAAGYGPQMERFLEGNPGLRSRFPSTMHFSGYTVDELADVFRRMAVSQGLAAGPDTLAAVRRHYAAIDRNLGFGNGRDVRNLLDGARKRMARRLSAADAPTQAELTEVLPADLSESAVFDRARPGSTTVSDLRAELDAMIGLTAVKSQVSDVIDLIVMSQRQARAGRRGDKVSPHLVFSGPPGTGKTTVARLYGRFLAALGVLPSGLTVEVDSGDLMATGGRSAAEQTKDVFLSARGGVLFIDEAYGLAPRDGSGRGAEAIDTLVKLMEDQRDEVAVIVAGYDSEMDRFLAANPGLASRFPKRIGFEPYTTPELVQVFCRLADGAGYVVDPPAKERVAARLDMERSTPGFGNGRAARNLLDAARTAHARRMRLADDQIDERLLFLLVAEDIERA